MHSLYENQTHLLALRSRRLAQRADRDHAGYRRHARSTGLRAAQFTTGARRELIYAMDRTTRA